MFWFFILHLALQRTPAIPVQVQQKFKELAKNENEKLKLLTYNNSKVLEFTMDLSLDDETFNLTQAFNLFDSVVYSYQKDKKRDGFIASSGQKVTYKEQEKDFEAFMTVKSTLNSEYIVFFEKTKLETGFELENQTKKILIISINLEELSKYKELINQLEEDIYKHILKDSKFYEKIVENTVIYDALFENVKDCEKKILNSYYKLKSDVEHGSNIMIVMFFSEFFTNDNHLIRYYIGKHLRACIQDIGLKKVNNIKLVCYTQCEFSDCLKEQEQKVSEIKKYYNDHMKEMKYIVDLNVSHEKFKYEDDNLYSNKNEYKITASSKIEKKQKMKKIIFGILTNLGFSSSIDTLTNNIKDLNIEDKKQTDMMASVNEIKMELYGKTFISVKIEDVSDPKIFNLLEKQDKPIGKIELLTYNIYAPYLFGTHVYSTFFFVNMYETKDSTGKYEKSIFLYHTAENLNIEFYLNDALTDGNTQTWYYAGDYLQTDILNILNEVVKHRITTDNVIQHFPLCFMKLSNDEKVTTNKLDPFIPEMHFEINKSTKKTFEYIVKTFYETFKSKMKSKEVNVEVKEDLTVMGLNKKYTEEKESVDANSNTNEENGMSSETKIEDEIKAIEIEKMTGARKKIRKPENAKVSDLNEMRCKPIENEKIKVSKNKEGNKTNDVHFIYNLEHFIYQKYLLHWDRFEKINFEDEKKDRSDFKTYIIEFKGNYLLICQNPDKNELKNDDFITNKTTCSVLKRIYEMTKEEKDADLANFVVCILENHKNNGQTFFDKLKNSKKGLIYALKNNKLQNFLSTTLNFEKTFLETLTKEWKAKKPEDYKNTDYMLAKNIKNKIKKIIHLLADTIDTWYNSKKVDQNIFTSYTCYFFTETGEIDSNFYETTNEVIKKIKKK